MADAGPEDGELHVAVAVIVRDERVLIARRPDHLHQGGLLEFPGGKVEPGETVQRALIREIAEETGLTVPEDSLEPLIGIRHDYGDRRVFLDVWRTRSARGEPEGLEGQAVEWVVPGELRDRDFPEANRPIIRALRLPSLLAITGAIEGVAPGVVRLTEALAHGHPPLVVLRAPQLDRAAYLALAGAAVELCESAGAGLIVHGPPSVFRQTPGAWGLHLPWREAQALSSRPIPGHRWLGVSCHNPVQIDRAVRLGADYITLGPVKATASHPGQQGLGWPAFRAMVSTAPVPVYALGGLNAGDAERARSEGGQGIAGIRFWWRDN